MRRLVELRAPDCMIKHEARLISQSYLGAWLWNTMWRIRGFFYPEDSTPRFLEQ